MTLCKNGLETQQLVCELEKVEKYYTPGNNVLGPISLRIYEGEILGLKGSNGAGKSTLLKIIAGVLSPDKGSCSLTVKTRERLAYVPQDVSLYMSLSGLENIEFWGAVCGLPSSILGKRNKWLLEKLDLIDKSKEPVSSYSGGMCRRLHFATGLIGSPKLLLLDEPTVGADKHSVDVILSMLESLREMDCTIVLVTHQEGELQRVCNRIITLDSGLIVKEELIR